MHRYVAPGENGLFDQKHQRRVLDDLALLCQTLAADRTTVRGAVLACWQRTQRLAEACSWHIEQCATVAWRMVAGLGGTSVLEGAGMTLDSLYGFPHVPGSSVKGLCRAVAVAETFEEHREALEKHDIADMTALDRELGEVNFTKVGRLSTMDHEAREALFRLSRIFGSQEAHGHCVFFDAVPDSFPKLEVDIVNVHYPEYYQGDEAPGDWQNPQPVYFLTVPRGTRFLFCVGARRALPESARVHIERWLRTGLSGWGVGAKKSAGYGAFDVSAPQTTSEPR
jgi:CRISPR-associated protein Cmr6